MKRVVESVAFAGIAPFALSGCNMGPVGYHEPLSGPMAEVRFIGAVDYTPILSNDGECIKYDLNWYKRLAYDGASDVTMKAVGNVPLRMSYQHRNGQMMCTIPFSFVPEDGKSYVVLNRYSENADAGFFDYLTHSNLGQCAVKVLEKSGNGYLPVQTKKIEFDGGFITCRTTKP